MFTQPADLADDVVSAVVQKAWQLKIRRIDYAPVGFGSYHWHAWTDQDRWFVTADDLVSNGSHLGSSPVERTRRLAAGLCSARALGDEGLTFVVAPIPTADGEILKLVEERWAVALYPYVDGYSTQYGAYPTTAERHDVIELLATLHQSRGPAHDLALYDDFAIPQRDYLASLADMSDAWTEGPYGEPARQLVDRHAAQLADRFARYDRLANAAAGRPELMVLTHGEPHAGNTINTCSGLMLIDWDTALIAPRERDLWSLALEEPASLDHYAAMAGVAPLPDLLDLYRLRWDLTEVSLYVALFRAPHTVTADTRVAWDGLRNSLQALSALY
jgi:spectinomycin phosphotransferase/16S rRNA (guanine(1405)-N(7))-methyltransferase